MRTTLVAMTRSRGSDEVEVLAPVVGWWSSHPRRGSLLGGGAHVGTIEVLGRRHALILPPEASGVVTGRLPADRRVAVQYGESLFTLGRLRDSGFTEAGPTDGTGVSEQTGGGQGWPVVAPTDGVFYRKPSPAEPAFVEVGSRVRAGQSLGLVESMKTFNPILFEGAGFPEEGEVVAILCEDAAEVTAGQVLMRIR